MIPRHSRTGCYLLSLLIFSQTAFAQTDYTKLYWTDYDANSIERINLDGSGRQTLITNAAPGSGPASLEVDVPHQKIYWLDNATYQIKRANLDGSGREVFITNPGYTYQMTLNAAATQLYWSDYDANSIERINVDGTNRQTVVANAADAAYPGNGPFSMALDETDNKVFWLDNFAVNIKSANLDGTGKQVFISNPGFANNLIIPRGSIPLPIHLISFTGYTTNCTPSLEWTTADAVNFNKFELQRSEDGSPFATIASLPYTRDKNSYQYLDKGTGNGELFYRLKMVDIDGDSTYSSIISARVDCGAPSTFSVYPNPVKGNAYLSTDKMIRQIDLISMGGQVVWSCVPAGQTGTIPLNFGKSVLKGVYVLKGTATDGTVKQVSVLIE